VNPSAIASPLSRFACADAGGFIFDHQSHDIKRYSTRAQRVMSFLALLQLA
jgi:hypothetical protein